MDIPRHLETNVYAFEGYALLYFQTIGCINERTAASDDAPRKGTENESFLHEEEQLIHTSTKLRMCNVICTHFEHELWIFAPTEEALSQILADRDGLPRDAVRFVTRGKLNIAEPLSNSTMTSSGKRNHESARIRSVCIEAIQGSISQALCKGLEAVPYGKNRILLRPQNTFARATFCAASTYNRHAGVTLSITVEITTLGTLLLHLSAQVQNLLCIDTLTTRQIGDNLTEQTRLTAHIAPGASPVHVDAREAVSSPHTRLTYSNSTWKQHVAQWLQCRGIESPRIDFDDQWVLLVPCPIHERSAPISAFLWPADLCFLEQARYETSEIDFFAASIASPNSSDGQDDDPLGFATSWVASRDEREIRRAKRAAARDWTGINLSRVSGNEELAPIKSSVSPARQGTTADLHNVAGIYPTPPDGLQSALSNIGALFESVNGVSEGFAESTTTSPAVRDFVDGDTHRPDVVESRCEGQDEDLDSFEGDLFGSDADMLDDVGVTEADFRFFDADLGDFNDGMSREAAPSPLAATKDHPAPFAYPLSANEDETLTGQPEKKDRLPNTSPQNLDRRPSIDGKPSLGSTAFPAALTPVEFSPHPPCGSLEAQRQLLQAQKVADDTDLLYGDSVIGNDYLRPLRFHNVLSNADARYVSCGRFGAMPRTKEPPQKQSNISKVEKKHNNIPLVGRPFRVDHNIHGHKTHSQDASRENWGNHARGSISEATGGDESDVASSTSGSHLAHDENSALTKRRRLSYGVHERSHQSQNGLLDAVLDPGVDSKVATRSVWQYLKEIGSSSRNSLDEFHNDTCATTDPCGVDPCGVADGCDPADYIAIAQLVAGQLASVGYMSSHEPPAISDSTKPQSIMSAMLGSGTHLDLHTLTQLRDDTNNVEMVGTKFFPKPNPRRPTNVTAGKDSSVNESFYLLPAPRVRVTRGDAALELLPTALPFWDTLGLGPACGPKDVQAMCIVPQGASTAISDYARKFLSTMHNAYSQCKLGSHEVAETEHGALVAVPKHGSLVDTCRNLGHQLAAADNTEAAYVIYIIGDMSKRSASYDICAAFHTLLQTHRQHLQDLGRPELTIVLQIVPLRMMNRYHAALFLDPSTAKSLAKQVYDRLPAHDLSSVRPTALLSTAYSVELGVPPPKMVHFQTSVTPPPQLLLEDSCMHVAYCLSDDGRWLTAAWTDDAGRDTATAAYCLGGQHDMRAGLTEIWQSTLNVLQERPVAWRVFVAKVGCPSPGEIEMWTSATESTGRVSLHLFSINPAPSLVITSILPTSNTLDEFRTSPPAAFTATPAATPTPSPAILSSAAQTPTTPAADNISAGAAPPLAPIAAPAPTDDDGTATLVDITDETHALVLARRLPLPPSACRALASGYIVRRGGSGADPCGAPATVMAPLEVNLVHSSSSSGSSGTPKRHAAVLREALASYRGLALLARARGVEDPRRGSLPWHAAFARRAARALVRGMPAWREAGGGGE